MAELTEDILSESDRMIFVKRTIAYMNWKYTSIEHRFSQQTIDIRKCAVLQGQTG